MLKEELVGVCIVKAQGAAIESQPGPQQTLEPCMPAKISPNNQPWILRYIFDAPKLA